MPAPAHSVMTALGFPRASARLYEQLARFQGRTLEEVARVLLRSLEELRRDVAPLLEGGVVTLEDGVLRVLPPEEAVVGVLRASATSAAAAHQRLEDVVRAIPLLAPEPLRPAHQPVDGLLPLDGEISRGGDRVDLVARLLATSRGDLLWFRPDQFRPPDADPIGPVIADVVAQGRRSRAIYPASALVDVPDTLTHRADLGEEIRLLPSLPTRMLIIGSSHAIIPEPLGFLDEPRSLIRQRGLVEALTLWFEALWSQAAPLRRPMSGDASPDRPDLRLFVLRQLAAGAQDEQIARQLGVSLRTVRRRVADLMAELGVESRFQAGVEAAKRGWV